MKKHFKKILLGILVILVVAFGFTGNYFYNFALNPKVDKSAIVNQDSINILKTYRYEQQLYYNNIKQNCLYFISCCLS